MHVKYLEIENVQLCGYWNWNNQFMIFFFAFACALLSVAMLQQLYNRVFQTENITLCLESRGDAGRVRKTKMSSKVDH
jgi:radical SAM superfamily enzyme